MFMYIEDDIILRGFEWEDNKVEPIVEIPDGIIEINVLDDDDCLSEDCKCLLEGVEAIIIPSSVQKISCFAFSSNNAHLISTLKKVYYQGTLSQWCAIEKGEDTEQGYWLSTGLIDYSLFFLGEDGEYRMVERLDFDGIDQILPLAFDGCNSLKEITLYKAKIGEQAFENCPNLNVINLFGYVELNFSEWHFPFDKENSCLEIRIFETAANVLDYDTLLVLVECGKVIYMETEMDISDNWEIFEEEWPDYNDSLSNVYSHIEKRIIKRMIGE